MSELLPVLRENAAPMALCAVCPKPGACCRRFTLTKESDGEQPSFWLETWREDALRYLRDRERPLPFAPAAVADEYSVDDPADADHGRKYVTVYFGCDRLTPEGRCSIYAYRPDVCRQFMPRSNRLCVLPPDSAMAEEGNKSA